MIFIELETEGLMLKKQYTYLVAGTKNCISIKANLDRHWQGLEVFAVCYRDNKEYPYAITNGECLIADMAVISTSGEFKLKLLGSTADGNVVMTTNVVTVYINDNKFSGAEGGELEYPTSDYLAEVLAGSKKQADRAQGYAEQAGQIKADTQSIADTAADNLDKIVQAGQQAMSDAVANVNRVAGDAKVDINSAVQAGKDDLAGVVAGSKAEVDTAVADAKNALQEQGKQAIAEVNTAADKAKTDMDTAIQNATAQADRAQGYADSVKDVEQELRADNARLTTDLKHANRRISVLYDLGKGITHRYETDSETAYSKDVPSGAKVMDVKLIGGRSVASNQRIQDVKFETDIDANSVWRVHGTQPIIFNNNVAMFTVANKWDGVSQKVEIIKNHTYYMYAEAKSDRENNGMLCPYVQEDIFGTENIVVAHGTEWSSYAVMNTAAKSTKSAIGVRAAGATTVIGATISCKNIQCIDLTQMFGAGNEPTLEQCREIFANEHYPYNAGTLTSADVTAVQVGDKVIPLPNSISLKSAGSVYDSLEFYEQDGKYYQKHTQRVGMVDLGTLTYSLASGASSPSTMIFSVALDIKPRIGLTSNNVICHMYQSNDKWQYVSFVSDKGIMVSSNANGRIFIRNDDYDNDAVGFKQAMQGVLLYYELATPIVTVTEIDNRFDAVDVSTGDKITFIGNSDYHLPVPNEEEYLIALNEVTA